MKSNELRGALFMQIQAYASRPADKNSKYEWNMMSEMITDLENAIADEIREEYAQKIIMYIQKTCSVAQNSKGDHPIGIPPLALSFVLKPSNRLARLREASASIDKRFEKMKASPSYSMAWQQEMNELVDRKYDLYEQIADQEELEARLEAIDEECTKDAFKFVSDEIKEHLEILQRRYVGGKPK